MIEEDTDSLTSEGKNSHEKEIANPILRSSVTLKTGQENKVEKHVPIMVELSSNSYASEATSSEGYFLDEIESENKENDLYNN